MKPSSNQDPSSASGGRPPSASELRLYNDLAAWFSLITPPGDYAEEAETYRQVLLKHSPGRIPEDLLDLGSGGGHNAFHLKAHFRMTLVDISSRMLEESRRLNPECEHQIGDMRTIDLGREYDAVLIHDAISYMNTEADLRAAVAAAFRHCRPGGAALFCPDSVKDTFQAGTTHGGADGDGRALRYLEWTWDPDPGDDWHYADYAFLLRDGDGSVRLVGDRHVLGLFSRAVWKKIVTDAGFKFFAEPFPHSSFPEGGHEIFIGRKE